MVYNGILKGNHWDIYDGFYWASIVIFNQRFLYLKAAIWGLPFY